MSVTVKAYLEGPSGGDPEIRRFAVDQDVSTSHTYLTTKLHQVFPGLQNKNYGLYWKDRENDLIAFSSDEELIEALSSMQDDIFRLYIKEKGSSGDNSQGNVHPGVVCDACEGPVAGTRYKCAVCPDYDLCEPCKGRGLHPEHMMIPISTPGGHPFMGFMGMGGPMGHGPPHGGFPHHGPPHGGPPHGGPHHGGPWGGHHGGQGGPPPHWRRWMRRCWRQWMNQQEGAEGDKETSPEGEAQKAEEAKAGEAKPEAQKQNDADTGEEPAEEYLRTVGETVAAMLDPLGIDVAVDVEHEGGQRERCASEERRQGGRGMGGGPMGGPWWMFGGPWGPGAGRGRRGGRCGRGMGGKCKGMGKQARQQANAGEGTSKDAEKDVNMKEATKEPEVHKKEQQKKAEDEIKEAMQTDGEKKDSDCEWTVVSPAEQMQTDSPAAPGSSEPASASSEPAATGTDGAAAGSNDGGSLYPQITDPELEVKIQEAIEQMKTMGFSDEGQWLTRLLVAKKGDISRVLDALQPARQ